MQIPTKIPTGLRKALYLNGFVSFCAVSNPSFCANDQSPKISGFSGFFLFCQCLAGLAAFHFVSHLGYIAEILYDIKQPKSLPKSLPKSRGTRPGISFS